MSGTRSRLAPRWALWSKWPGQRGDYGIIEDGTGGQDRTELARWQDSLLPGTPASRHVTGPRALPWVSFGAGESAGGGCRLTVAVIEWPADERRDGTGRRIAASRYFDLDYDEVAEVGAGFVELHRAVARINLPPADPLTEVVVEATSLAGLAEDIQKLGFEWTAQVAALLLESPVVLIADTLTEVEERLPWLDAIAALLPYGLRGDLTASTWAPSESMHAIRLAFSSRARAGQRPVCWPELPGDGCRTEWGSRYLAWLHHLESCYELPDLVTLLWRDTRRYSFDAPEQILASLAVHDQLYDVWQRWTSGRAEVGEVRDALRAADPATVRPDMRHDLLAALVEHGSEEDLGELVQWPPDTVLELVAVAVVAEDWDRAQALLRVAEQVDGRQALRARLIEGYSGQPDADAARCQVAKVLLWWPPPELGQEEALRTALEHQPELALEVLLRGTETGEAGHLPEWVRWLTEGQPEQAPDWLWPFTVALFGTGPLTPTGADHVAAGGDRAVLAILAVASRHTYLDQVLPALGTHLISTGNPQASRAGQVRMVLASADLTLGPARAVADLVAVVHGGNARYGVDITPQERDAYALRVTAELDKLSRPDQRTRATEALVRSLLVVGHPMAVPLATRDLLFRLADGVEFLGLKWIVLQALAQAVLQDRLAFTTLPEPRRDELLAVSPALRQRTALDDLRGAVRTGQADDQLLALWVGADLQGCPPLDMIGCLAGWSGGNDSERLLGLFDRVGRELAQYRSLDHVCGYLAECVRLILTGALGQTAAWAALDRIYAEGPRQLEMWAAWLQTADQVSRPDPVPAGPSPVPGQPGPSPVPGQHGGPQQPTRRTGPDRPEKPGRRKFFGVGPRTQPADHPDSRRES